MRTMSTVTDTGVAVVQARMKNPGAVVPGAWDAFQSMFEVLRKSELDPRLMHLVHLRASQINGCSVCADYGWREARKEGETDDRLFAIATWRETPYFTEAERAALALTEAVTRLSDRPESISDEIWAEVSGHFSEKELAALVLAIATTNMVNRVNATTRQIVGIQGW
jgi:AhpD family alkylhydroperoxidase